MLLCKCLFEKSVFSSAQRSCDYRSAATFVLQLSNESGGWPTATISAGCKEVEGRKISRLTRILKTLYQWQWQCRLVFELDVEITLVIAALLIRSWDRCVDRSVTPLCMFDNPMSRSGGRKQTTGQRLFQTPAPWKHALGSLAACLSVQHKCCYHKLPTADGSSSSSSPP